MKKLLLAAMLFCGGLVAFSQQLVQVSSFTKVPLQAGAMVSQPTISPDGSFVVAADASGSVLSKIDVATGSSKVLATNAGALGVVISNDGENVMFRRTTTKNHLRYTSLHNVSLNTGKETQIVAPTRHLAGYTFAGTTANAVENGKLRTKSLTGAAAQKDIVVSIDYGHLNVTINGNTKTLDPQGRSSYLWPQLSPDKTKIVYWVAYKGCYVCNIDGSNPVSLGELRAAKWLGNDMVVGMKDADNGQFVTSSSLIVADLKGNRQTITESSMIAMYPSATADGKHIAFVSGDGELFVINLK